MAVMHPKYPVKVPVTFAGINGATLVAAMINIWLHGMALLMVLQYFKWHATKDRRVVRWTVIVLMILSTLETIFASHQVYDIFITKNTNKAGLDRILFSVPGRYITTYLTAFVSQIFFSSCIWTLGKNLGSRLRYYAIPALVFAFMQLITGLTQAGVMAACKTFTNLTMRTDVVVKTTAIQGAAAAISDIIISVTFIYLFRSQRSGTASRADTLINKMIKYAINRAIATSFCAVAGVILFYFCSGTYYFMIPMFANTHIYVISVVSILTSESLRGEVDESRSMAPMGNNTTVYGDNLNASRSDVSGIEKVPV